MTEFNVTEFVVGPEKQGPELFRLLQLLPYRGHWDCEIRPYREVSDSDVLTWHVSDPVRMAAEGSEDMWRGDHLMLKFLKRLSELPRGEIRPLVEVILTTAQTDVEDKPIPVLELRYLEERSDLSEGEDRVIGQQSLVSNGINYRPGGRQTVNGFAGAAQMIKMNQWVMLNCDNVEDLKPKFQKLGMRLLVSARIEV